MLSCLSFFPGIYETPAGTILYHAHLDIEGITMDRVKQMHIQAARCAVTAPDPPPLYLLKRLDSRVTSTLVQRPCYMRNFGFIEIKPQVLKIYD